jgi:hypothetical protein
LTICLDLTPSDSVQRLHFETIRFIHSLQSYEQCAEVSVKVHRLRRHHLEPLTREIKTLTFDSLKNCSYIRAFRFENVFEEFLAELAPPNGVNFHLLTTRLDRILPPIPWASMSLQCSRCEEDFSTVRDGCFCHFERLYHIECYRCPRCGKVEPSFSSHSEAISSSRCFENINRDFRSSAWLSLHIIIRSTWYKTCLSPVPGR